MNYEPFAREIPRRLKLSAREIGVALALTFAAAVQLISALSGREEKGAHASALDPAALVRPSALMPE